MINDCSNETSHAASAFFISSMTKISEDETTSDDVFTENEVEQSGSTVPALPTASRFRPATVSYTTPISVLNLRQQTDARIRRSSFSQSSSSIDLTSLSRRASFSTSSSFDLSSRRSTSFLSLTGHSKSISYEDDCDGGQRPPIFQRQESLLETMERQRRENISRKLRQIREAAPPPSTNSRYGTMRRRRTPNTDDETSETKLTSDLSAEVSRPKPPTAMPTIMPFNRTVSSSMLQTLNSMSSAKSRGIGSGSVVSLNGNGTSNGNGPMRADWSIPATKAASRTFSSGEQNPETDHCYQPMTPSAVIRNAPQRLDDVRQANEQSWSHGDKSKMPTSSVQRSANGTASYSRQLFRAASVDCVFQTSTTHDYTTKRSEDVTEKQSETQSTSCNTNETQDLTSRNETETGFDKMRDLISENETETDSDIMPDQTAVRSIMTDKVDQPPPSLSPNTLPPESINEETVTDQAIKAATTNSASTGEVIENPATDGSEVFEDVGEDAHNVGERNFPTFQKPRPPLSRSRTPRSPSPSTTFEPSATAADVAPDQLPLTESAVVSLPDFAFSDRSDEELIRPVDRTNLSANDAAADTHVTTVHRADELDGSHPRSCSNHNHQSEEEIKNATSYDLPADRNRSSFDTMNTKSSNQDVENSNSVRMVGENSNDFSRTLQFDDRLHTSSCDDEYDSPVTNSTAGSASKDLSCSYAQQIQETNENRITEAGVTDFQLTQARCLPTDEREISNDIDCITNLSHASANLDGSSLSIEDVQKIMNQSSSAISSTLTCPTPERNTSVTPTAAEENCKNLDRVEMFDDEEDERSTPSVQNGQAEVNDPKDRETDKIKENGNCKTDGEQVVDIDSKHAINRRKDRIANGENGIFDFYLTKDCVGIGFCIQGGKDATGNHSPVTIKRLFKGDTWAKGHLQAGDEIISVNGQSFSSLSLYDAWNLLRSIPDGLVQITIRRSVTI